MSSVTGRFLPVRSWLETIREIAASSTGLAAVTCPPGRSRETSVVSPDSQRAPGCGAGVGEMCRRDLLTPGLIPGPGRDDSP
jgi:hypothetical protein